MHTAAPGHMRTRGPVSARCTVVWDGGKRTTQQKVVEVLFSTSLAGCKSAAGCGCMVWCWAALGMLAHPSCIGAVLHKSACMQCCMVAAAAWWSADCLRHSHAQGGTGARPCSTCTRAHLCSFSVPQISTIAAVVLGVILLHPCQVALKLHPRSRGHATFHFGANLHVFPACTGSILHG